MLNADKGIFPIICIWNSILTFSLFLFITGGVLKLGGLGSTPTKTKDETWNAFKLVDYSKGQNGAHQMSFHTHLSFSVSWQVTNYIQLLDLTAVIGQNCNKDKKKKKSARVQGSKEPQLLVVEFFLFFFG